MGGIDPSDLVNSAQVAERLGIPHHQTVLNWAKRHEDFPKPVWERGRLAIWLWSEVRAWAKATGRLPDGAPD